MTTTRRPVNAVGTFAAKESSFGAAPSTQSSWYRSKTIRDGASMTLETNAVDPNYMFDDLQHDDLVTTNESGTLTIGLAARAGVDAAAPTDAAVINPVIDIYASPCIATIRATSGIALTGAGTDVTAEATGIASGYSLGDIVAIDYNGGGTHEMAMITDIATADTISFFPTLTGSTTTDGEIDGTVNFVPGHPISTSSSIFRQSDVVSLLYRWEQMNGCVGNMSIPEVNASELINFQFDYQVDNFTVDETNAAGLPVTISGGANDFQTEASEIVFCNSTFKYNDVAYPVISFSFDFQNEISESQDGTVDNCRNIWQITGYNPKFTIKTYWDTRLRDFYDSREGNNLIFSCGTYPNTLAIGMPNAVITEFPDSDNNGMMTVDVTFEAKRDSSLDDGMPDCVLALAGKQS